MSLFVCLCLYVYVKDWKMNRWFESEIMWWGEVTRWGMDGWMDVWVWMWMWCDVYVMYSSICDVYVYKITGWIRSRNLQSPLCHQSKIKQDQDQWRGKRRMKKKKEERERKREREESEKEREREKEHSIENEMTTGPFDKFQTSQCRWPRLDPLALFAAPLWTVRHAKSIVGPRVYTVIQLCSYAVMQFCILLYTKAVKSQKVSC